MKLLIEGLGMPWGENPTKTKLWIHKKNKKTTLKSWIFRHKSKKEIPEPVTWTSENKQNQSDPLCLGAPDVTLEFGCDWIPLCLQSS